ncbi:flagellar basal body rod protein FlgC [Pleionea sp. CnH1-48]|uniref:flagellar basal body rod protein FlgC n=1 Tax=Pleionea sp. CnH1-48 TaxID=2954494 RepID=UPI002096D9AB|nr:flagellar basal body rod C-terminal domain-containing protein [Pleionea sp. CnH1-48]MCO7223715.1 hypothetical protein [Pleionea sp. CnH1-48]
MSFDAIFHLSRVAMQTEMARAEIASFNIARANTPLNPHDVNQATKTFSSLIGETVLEGQDTPLVSELVAGIKRVFEPDHPMADSEGFVSYPDVDIAEQFIAMTLSKRAYEANIRAFNNAGQMYAKALEIGRG